MAKGKFEYWLTDEGLLKIEGWCRDGLVDEQIAHNMGIAYSTFKAWKVKFGAISDVLKRSKEVVDYEVENALLKRALGYKYNEVTHESIYNKDSGEYEMKVTKIVEKEVVADTTAQIFWLKNRKPEEWRDRRDVESKVQFESDGFIDALKGQVEETFKDAGDVIEE